MTQGIPLRLQGISKSFGRVQALKPLDIEVQQGEMLALLGPSGCGKTTTLRIISGFESTDTGCVMIGDRDVTEVPPNKRAIGMVFQSYSLFPHMTVAENVAFGLRMRGVDRTERDKRVRAMLDVVRLSNFESREISQLSGGQQQRVALARALVTNPTILLLDEPLGALDKSLRERMQFELREIQRRLGITSILVTHDQEEALTMSDRIAVMAEGQILQIGTPTEVYQRPCSRFVSEFLGTANNFDGHVLGQEQEGIWHVELQGGAHGCVASPRSLKVGQEVCIAVRPENLRVSIGIERPLRAVVRDKVFRGSYVAYEMQAMGIESPLFLYSQDHLAVPADGVVSLGWQAQGAILLTE